jgi:hypothetical protein
MRTCILHVGTHKTGTTSLQVFIHQNEAALLQAGLLYPHAGRPPNVPTGNHQIAWDLLVHERSSDLAPLTDELRASPVDSALMTSEDFCLLYAKPHTIALLKASIEDAGYRAKVLIYLRPQASYLESIYVERIKHNYVRTLGSFVERSLATGMYHVDDSPIQLELRYTRLLGPWIEAFGRENIVVQPYVPGQPNAQIFQEFIRLVAALAPGFGNSPLSLTASQPRANDSIDYGGLLETAFSKLLPQRPHAFSPTAIVSSQVPGFPRELFGQRFSLLARDETVAFLEAFGPENAGIERDFGIRIPFQNESDIAPPDDPVWQKARLERALFDQLLAIWMGEAQRQSGNGSS